MTDTSKTAVATPRVRKVPGRVKNILSAGMLCFGVVATILWAAAIAWGIPRLFL